MASSPFLLSNHRLDQLSYVGDICVQTGSGPFHCDFPNFQDHQLSYEVSDRKSEPVRPLIWSNRRLSSSTLPWTTTSTIVIDNIKFLFNNRFWYWIKLLRTHREHQSLRQRYEWVTPSKTNRYFAEFLKQNLKTRFLRGQILEPLKIWWPALVRIGTWVNCPIPFAGYESGWLKNKKISWLISGL